MKCRLCLEEKTLVEAHIIPEFMYQELFDEDHRLYKVVVADTSKYSKIPTGEYDQNILCADCDNGRIGQLDDYAAKVIYGGLSNSQDLEVITLTNPAEGIQETHVKNIDYQKFKLFLLSILWKASITKREFFSFVSLCRYEEAIRQMLYNRDPKEPNDFPCLMIAHSSDVSESIIKPTKTRSYLKNGKFDINRGIRGIS